MRAYDSKDRVTRRSFVTLRRRGGREGRESHHVCEAHRYGQSSVYLLGLWDGNINLLPCGSLERVGDVEWRLVCRLRCLESVYGVKSRREIMMVSFLGMHVRPVFVSLREVETMTYFRVKKATGPRVLEQTKTSSGMGTWSVSLVLGPFCSIDGFALSRLVTGQGCVDMGVEDNLLLSGARRHEYTTFFKGYWPCMLIYQMHLSSLLLSENERLLENIYTSSEVSSLL